MIYLSENVTLGADIPDNVLLEWFRDFGLDGWLSRLKRGLDTRVGEKGVALSAGQRQRLNLVRGLLLNRDGYILDEPTSHLDAETEALVVRALKKRLSGKTAVIVTHRPALQSLCQRAYEMRGHVLRMVQ